MDETPLVSTVMPTWNRARFIAEALESVLGQHYGPLEVIVVDDGSTDNTPQVLRRFDGCIKYIRQENVGSAAARNTGTELARGQYVAVLDSDDVWLAGKIEKQVRLLLTCPDVDVVFGAARLVDAEGTPIEGLMFGPEGLQSAPLPLSFPARRWTGDVVAQLLRTNPIPHSSVLIKRQALAAVGGYDPRVRTCEDFDLWMRLALGGARFAYLDQIVCKHRVHPGRLTESPDRGEIRARALVGIYGREDFPASLRGGLSRDIAASFKVAGDKALARGESRRARRCYVGALRYRPRPTQTLSWACTWLGPVGRKLVDLINPGNEIFREPKEPGWPPVPSPGGKGQAGEAVQL